MKKKILVCIIFFLSLNYLVTAQIKDEKTKWLEYTVTEAIFNDCHLTFLSLKKKIQINRDTIFIGLSFDNESLRAFWSKEVAVQYVFDAALYPITNALWDLKNGNYRRYQKIIFYVDIHPHDIPPVLLFEILLKDWDTFKDGRDKVTLFENLTITAEGKPFEFDAREAVSIE